MSGYGSLSRVKCHHSQSMGTKPLRVITRARSINKKTGKLAFGNIKNRVLEVAKNRQKNEINRTTLYRLDYTNVKNGRTVEAIDSHINMKYH